jgi:hypothetical protein
MANWSNCGLVVTGYPHDLRPFRRAAGALRGRIDTSRSEIFPEEFEYGECEGGDLVANGVKRLPGGFQSATYGFHAINRSPSPDPAEHFKQISRRFPRLAFVLVESDHNVDSHGSYLLLNGRRRWWSVPRKIETEVMERWYRWYGLVNKDGTINWDDDSDGQYAAICDGIFEMMDIAAAKWNEDVFAWLKRLPGGAPASARPARRKRNPPASKRSRRKS